MAESKEASKTCVVSSSDEMTNIINHTFGSTVNNCCSNSDSQDLSDVINIHKSNSQIDLTLDSINSEEDLEIIGSVVGQVNNSNQKLNAPSSSNYNFKDQCAIGRKHQTELSLDLSDDPLFNDCSPSKIPKIESTLTSFNYLSNSTITSANKVNKNINHFNINTSTIEHSKKIPERVCLKNPEIYCQALDIFPHVDKDYLTDLCNKESDLNSIINIILETNHNNFDGPPRLQNTLNDGHLIGSDSSREIDADPNFKNCCLVLKSINESHNCNEDQALEKQQVGLPTASSKNKQLEFLAEVLPDADLSYLETKSRLTESELKEFLYEAMEKKDYPRQIVTIEQKAESSEYEDIGLYTTDFDLENFLKIFPEPFKYFMDENRVCEFGEHAFEFLKRRLRNQSVKMIGNTYKELGYNMSRTYEALESKPSTRVSKRPLNEIKMPTQSNLPFLQEACFVEHKEEIKNHIESKAEAKRLVYEQAKERGELFECECCFEESMFEDCGACNEGDHLFCKHCIKRSAEVRIGDGLSTFPCLQDCGSEFSLHLLQNLLDAIIFSKLLKRIQLEEVRAADIEGLEVCPFCEFATIPPPETNIFTCLNTECLKESCRKCHKVSHIPQRCEEVESDDQARARKYIEDEMTKALVRECYKCKKKFIKVEGCNKMTCTCGAKMCYICRQPVVDYKHFNGPGGSDTNKCPLYSTEKVLHVDAVKAVAEESLKRLSEMNPSLKLKHDPTKVLPTCTAKSSLPNGMHENEAVLLQRLQERQQMNRFLLQHTRNTLNQPPAQYFATQQTAQPHVICVHNNTRVPNTIGAQGYRNAPMTYFPRVPNHTWAEPNVRQVPNRNPTVPILPLVPNRNPTVPLLPQVQNNNPSLLNSSQERRNHTMVLQNNLPAPTNQPNNILPYDDDDDYLEQLQRLDDVMEQIRVELQDAKR